MYLRKMILKLPLRLFSSKAQIWLCKNRSEVMAEVSILGEFQQSSGSNFDINCLASQNQ